MPNCDILLRMEQKGRYKVVIAIPTNGTDGREQMSGIFKYLNEHPQWELQTINAGTGILNGGLANAARDADGIILGCACDKELIDTCFRNPDLKMVACEDRIVRLCRKRANCRTMQIDSLSVGMDAARRFNALGRFASYGFVHGPFHFPWSIDRKKGFCSLIPKKAPVFSFPKRTPPGPNPVVISQSQLAEWVARLPKPAAVFGANDRFASEVLTVCRRLGLAVPQQVSVLGCDNDPLICHHTQPTLSSLQLPFAALGYKAAATLDRMLLGEKTSRNTVYVAGTRFFARASTAYIPPATMLVERALTFISEHACDGICVNDVAAHLSVSRSLLDIRFRQVCGGSVHARILEARLDEVKRQLSKTDHTILQIGNDCGFNDPDNLKRLFRKRFGVSMRQYRQDHEA